MALPFFLSKPLLPLETASSGFDADPTPKLGTTSGSGLEIGVTGWSGAAVSWGAASRPLVRGLEGHVLALGDEHPARLRPFVAGDDPAAFEHVDQAARSCVADA